MELRPAKTEWRPHAGAAPARRFDDSVLATVQFVFNPPAAKEQQIGMSVRMVSDNVTPCGNFSSQTGMLTHIFAEEEKRRCDAMPVQQREQARGDRRIRTIIESQGARVPGAGNYRSEQ